MAVAADAQPRVRRRRRISRAAPRGVSGCGLQHGRGARAAEQAEQVRRRVGIVRARGDDDQQRQVVDPARQVGEHLQRRRGRPTARRRRAARAGGARPAPRTATARCGRPASSRRRRARRPAAAARRPPRARRRAAARARAAASRSGASSSARTTPKGKWRSSGPGAARRTRQPAAAASAAACSSSAVLPRPAGGLEHDDAAAAGGQPLDGARQQLELGLALDQRPARRCRRQDVQVRDDGVHCFHADSSSRRRKALERQAATPGGLANGLGAAASKRREARLVLRDEDRAQVADRRPLARVSSSAARAHARRHGSTAARRLARRTARRGTRPCARRYGRAPAGEITETRSLNPAPAAGGQTRGELRPRADAELRVGVREVHLDRVHGDEERLRDLLVREPLRRQLGDAPLGGRQLAAGARPARADARELGARLARPSPASRARRTRPPRCSSDSRARAPLPEPPLRPAEARAATARASKRRPSAP